MTASDIFHNPEKQSGLILMLDVIVEQKNNMTALFSDWIWPGKLHIQLK